MTDTVVDMCATSGDLRLSLRLIFESSTLGQRPHNTGTMILIVIQWMLSRFLANDGIGLIFGVNYENIPWLIYEITKHIYLLIRVGGLNVGHNKG